MVTAALSRLMWEGSPTLGSGGNRIQETRLGFYRATFSPPSPWLFLHNQTSLLISYISISPKLLAEGVIEGRCFWKGETAESIQEAGGSVNSKRSSAQKTQIAPPSWWGRWCLFSHLLWYYPARRVAPSCLCHREASFRSDWGWGWSPVICQDRIV